MEEKLKKLLKETLPKKLPIIIIIIGIAILVAVLGSYMVKKKTFEDAKQATETYSGNIKFDPEKGIIIQKENEDGTLSEVDIEEIFDQIYQADTYLKDDLESTKYEKLEYLLNAEVVTNFPYISSIGNDESKLNGIVKLYRFTNKEEAEEAEGKKETETTEPTENVLDPKKIFYIGDSWTVRLGTIGIPSEEHPGENHILAEVGVAPSADMFSEENLKEKIDAVSSDVTAIVIALGINGPTQANEMNKIIDFLSSTYSNKVINVLKVPHMGKNFNNGQTADEWNLKIDEYNKAVSEHCLNISNVLFVDTIDELMTEDGYLNPKYADGEYHLNNEGNEIWYKKIKEKIGNGTNEPGSTVSSPELEKYQMTYITEEELDKKIKECEKSGSKDVYKYFSLNENNEIVIATWTKSTTTVTTDDPTITVATLNEESTTNYANTSPGVYTTGKYSLNKKELVTCKDLVSKYSMPFNLLWAFLVQTGSYDFTEELAELAYESEIHIAVYDNENKIERIDTENYSKSIRYTENTELIVPEEVKTGGIETSCHGTIEDGKAIHTNNLGQTEEGTIYSHYITGATPGGVITAVSDEEKRYTTTTTEITIGATNPTIGVLYVDNWAAKWEVFYKLEEEDKDPHNSSGVIEAMPYRSLAENKISYALKSGNSLMGKNLTKHSEEIKVAAIAHIAESNDVTLETTPVTVNKAMIKKHLDGETTVACSICLDQVKIYYGKSLKDLKKEGKEAKVYADILVSGKDKKNTLLKTIYNHVYTYASKAQGATTKAELKEQLKEKITYKQWPTTEVAKVNIEYTTKLNKTSNVYKIDDTDYSDVGLKFKELVNKPKHYKSKKSINGGLTEWFWDYIRSADNTKDLEDLLKVVFNEAFETKKYGDFDEEELKEIFSAFEPQDSTTLVYIYGGTTAEKIWFALLEVGYSEYAVAGALGNLHCESGFQTNNLEDIFEAGGSSDFVTIGKYKISYTDETYTEAVDRGIITKEEFISDHYLDKRGAGYGLAQWTWYTRKAALYDYAQSKGVSIADEDMQIEFLISELPNYEYDNWLYAESPEEAAIAFCHNFENENITETEYREQRAREYYDKFHGKTIDEQNDSKDYAHRMLKAAQEVHDDEIDWIYYTEHPLGVNSLINSDIEGQLNNPNKTTCCSTYVSCVLYKAGYFTEAEMNSFHYHGPAWIEYWLNKEKWKKITNKDDFKPGDIVFMDKKDTEGYDHVQIYAGDWTWYNAGSTEFIQSPAPYKNEIGWTIEFDSWWARRPPSLGSGYPKGLKLFEIGNLVFPLYPQVERAGEQYILYSDAKIPNSDYTLGEVGCPIYAASSIVSGLLADAKVDPKTYLEELSDYFPGEDLLVETEGESYYKLWDEKFLKETYSNKLNTISLIGKTEEDMIKIFEEKEGKCGAIVYVGGHFLAAVPVLNSDGKFQSFQIIDSVKNTTGKFESGEEFLDKVDVYEKFLPKVIIYYE